MSALAEREFELRLAAEGEVMRLRAEVGRLRTLAEELADELSTHFGSTNLVKRAREAINERPTYSD